MKEKSQNPCEVFDCLSSELLVLLEELPNLSNALFSSKTFSVWGVSSVLTRAL